MKVVFCIDDNPQYVPLLKVAIRSLRALHAPDEVQCVCVYAGDKQQVIDVINNENAQWAHYSPQLNRQTLPVGLQHSIGCFLKLELSLIPELANDSQVLYCDVDVMFRKSLRPLFEAPMPPYLAMAKEHTAPFYHPCNILKYIYNKRQYTVPMPFPIWTYSSGVVRFNLARLREHNLIQHFLAFSLQNVDKIGNLDQSLLNYYFGKKITRLGDCWNRPPYQADSLEKGAIIHFHGPKPWDTTSKCLEDLRINQFEPLRQKWFEFLSPEEREAIKNWTA